MTKLVKPFFLFLLSSTLLICSCAKLPIESVKITQYMVDEGERMHQINVQLLNGIFKSKQEQIDSYITNEYSPFILKTMLKQVDSTDKPQTVIPDIMKYLLPKVITKRDQMQSELETVRLKVITKLDYNYNNFQQTALSLKNLLLSNVKVTEERNQLLSNINNYTGNKVDLNAIESVLDNYLFKAGDAGVKAVDLNNQIDSILNK